MCTLNTHKHIYAGCGVGGARGIALEIHIYTYSCRLWSRREDSAGPVVMVVITY